MICWVCYFNTNALCINCAGYEILLDESQWFLVMTSDVKARLETTIEMMTTLNFNQMTAKRFIELWLEIQHCDLSQKFSLTFQCTILITVDNVLNTHKYWYVKESTQEVPSQLCAISACKTTLRKLRVNSRVSFHQTNTVSRDHRGCFPLVPKKASTAPVQYWSRFFQLF